MVRLRARLLPGLVALALAGPSAAEPPPLPRPEAEAAVCGDPALIGRPLAAISDGDGCGLAAPVSLSEAGGVALEPPATVGCGTARALAAWLAQGPGPGFAGEGEHLEALTVVDAYSCRNRNRAEDGKLSEHAKGNAIDIAGFRLGDGTVVTVLDGWGSAEWGAVLRQSHAAGCGTFGTVLGPEANPLHADHLHLDVEQRRSGPYCR
jgi:hypothetical protein